jgi:hypothetical protein
MAGVGGKVYPKTDGSCRKASLFLFRLRTINLGWAEWRQKRRATMQWILAVLLGIVPMMVLADAVPQAVAAQAARNPDKYLEDLAVLIAGYGQDGAIDAAGLQNMVAMARADARAVALRRLQGADLDGDGAIGGVEMRIKAAALAAAARGRLIVNFGKADRDGDDQVTGTELQSYANQAAEQAFGADKAAAVLAILALDRSGDGRVTLAEATAALATLAPVSGAREIRNELRVEGKDRPLPAMGLPVDQGA